MKKTTWRFAVSGAAAGAANGLFGGGGGSVLVPLLTRFCGLEQRQAFSTSLAVILPLCVLSAAVYLFRGGLDLLAALPYLPIVGKSLPNGTLWMTTNSFVMRRFNRTNFFFYIRGK